MKYELDVLAALTQLPQPTTQEIVAVTGISERKVQNVIKSLQLDLNIGIESIKKGRVICYVVKDWGVFTPGHLLKKTLANRPLKYDNKMSVKVNKEAFYDSVKMSNYRESARLEGISIHSERIPDNKKSVVTAKQNLIKKYSKYKNMSNSYG